MKSLNLLIFLAFYSFMSLTLFAQENKGLGVFSGYWFAGDSCFATEYRLILDDNYVIWESVTGKHEYYKLRILKWKVTDSLLVIDYENFFNNTREKLAFKLDREGKLEFLDKSLFRCTDKAVLESVLYDIPLSKYENFIQKLTKLNCSKRQIVVCIEKIWSFVDASNDRELSTAEIARSMRLFIKSFRNEMGKGLDNKLDKTETAENILYEVTNYAQKTIDNFDYDGNGKISKKELFFDVTFEDLSQLDIGGFNLIKILEFMDKEKMNRLRVKRRKADQKRKKSF
jgi:hypothetical protein